MELDGPSVQNVSFERALQLLYVSLGVVFHFISVQFADAVLACAQQIYFVVFVHKLPANLAVKLVFHLQQLLFDFLHVFNYFRQKLLLVQTTLFVQILLSVFFKSGGELQWKTKFTKMVPVGLTSSLRLHTKVTLLAVFGRDLNPLRTLQSVVVVRVHSYFLHVGTAAC